MDVGSNLTLAVRAVGNVSVINASDERFICKTGFACNRETRNDVDNRYLQCSLRTPANINDNGRILTIMLDNMELNRFSLTGSYK